MTPFRAKSFALMPLAAAIFALPICASAANAQYNTYRSSPNYSTAAPPRIDVRPSAQPRYPTHGPREPQIAPRKIQNNPRGPASPPSVNPNPPSRNIVIPSGERRFLANEVVLEIPDSVTPQNLDAMARQHGLTRMQSQRFPLIGATLYRWRINDGRSVADIVRQLQTDRRITAVQPNYSYSLQQTLGSGDPAQYTLVKLRLNQAHQFATGNSVLVAVIDSGIDAEHPDLKGVIANTLDTLEVEAKPHSHGTAMAGAIASRGRVLGVAPSVRILAVRAFGPTSNSAEGTTFNILRGLDWAAAEGARIINMSFAGPQDALLSRALAAARARGIILIAAAGNAGPKSPPLFPAADPSVIAVTATDVEDKIFSRANHGQYVAIAAPGVDILAPAPNGGYQVSSGTSIATAHISGIAALLVERKPELDPASVRRLLMTTAKDLGRKGRDDEFGAGLADAFEALIALDPNAPATAGAARR